MVAVVFLPTRIPVSIHRNRRGQERTRICEVIGEDLQEDEIVNESNGGFRVVGEGEAQGEFEELGSLLGEEYSWTTEYGPEPGDEQQDPFHLQ